MRACTCKFGLFAQKFNYKYFLRLAVQIFDVLRSIGGYHSFSDDIVIGGKNLKDERVRLSNMNILVATTGRLLQHMGQTVGFDSTVFRC
jgi:ATP-dependent RNA helicase DDX10/DBP4